MKRLALGGAVAVLALAAASQTLAQAPSAAPSGRVPPAASARGPHDRAELERQRERMLEELKKRGLDLRSANLPPLALPSGSASGGAVAPLSSAGDLAQRWRAFAESRLARRERNRAALVKELGSRLQDPRVKDEVKLHVTRVAELNRLEFLANNARTGAAQARLLGRLAKLRAKEEQRHRAKLAELAAAAPSSSAPSPSPSPAPSGSGAAR
jgi:hypothetical protein